MDDNKNNDKKNSGKSNYGTGMCVGLGLGTAAGLLVYVLAGSILWMPLCMGIGMCLGLAIGSDNADDAGSKEAEKAPAADDNNSDKQ